ncbi:MAG: hypothetical protein RXS42_07625 [Nitrososphaeria archaeon]
MSYPCPLSPLRPSEAATPAEAEWISSLCRAVVPRLGGDLLAPAARAVVRKITREPAGLENTLNALAEVAAAVAAGHYIVEYWWVDDLVPWQPLIPNRAVTWVGLPATDTRYDERLHRWVMVPVGAIHRHDIYLRAMRTGRPKVELLAADDNVAVMGLTVFPAAQPPADLLEEMRARVIAAALEAALEEGAGA